jgi:hypothetical protein
MTKTLFFIGNKRSGTSHLVRLLNIHPKIFISHESDVVWILYQFHNDMPLATHPWDSPKGMQISLESCGHILKRDCTPAENFFAFQECLMKKGNPWLPPMHKQELLWIGDKKPFQLTDPVLIDFVLQLFPDAHFIHLVRHPFDVALSAEQFNETHFGDFWKDLTLEEKVKRWAFHENKVLELKRSARANIVDIRYEDLCQETETEMVKIFNFLNLNADRKILRRAAKKTCPIVKKKVRIPCDEETLSTMEHYSYKPYDEKGRSVPTVDNIFRRLRRAFHVARGR